MCDLCTDIREWIDLTVKPAVLVSCPESGKLVRDIDPPLQHEKTE